MLKFSENRWEGNKWASIEISPVDMSCFPRVLLHLEKTYGFKRPEIIDILDGYVTDFEVLGSQATIHIDNWSFSIAFEDGAVRDRVLSELQSLPSGYFEAQTIER